MFSPPLVIFYIVALLAGFFLARKFIGPYQDRLAAWEKANAKKLKSPYNLPGSHMFWTVPLFIILAALLLSWHDIFK